MNLNEYFNNLVEEKERLLNENTMLKRALNKACAELSSMDYKLKMHENPYAYTCNYTDEEEWKKWAMDNERW